MAKTKIPQDVIDRVKGEHAGKELELVETEDVAVIIRPADPTAWQRYMDEIVDDDKRSRASRNLVMHCVVYPERDDFLKLLQQLPALVAALFPACTQISGNKAVSDRKKL